VSVSARGSATDIGDWRLTTMIPVWESALFAGQPSLYLSERLAFVPLSEAATSFFETGGAQ
jgi:hypothetical protein